MITIAYTTERARRPLDAAVRKMLEMRLDHADASAEIAVASGALAIGECLAAEVAGEHLVALERAYAGVRAIAASAALTASVRAARAGLAMDEFVRAIRRR